MLAVLLSVSIAWAQPQPPMWPNVFWQNFTEVTYYPDIGRHHNEGAYFYNYSIPAYRISRSDGQYDRFCSLSGPHQNQTTPCDQIVVGGNRYLYYPVLQQCCYCCNSTAGCGVLTPSWLQDAKYIDTEVHNGILSYKWSKQGGQQNYIWETTGKVPLDRETVAIFQVDDDDMNFERRSNTFPAEALTLPSICSLSNTCNWGYCQQLRDGTTTHHETAFF